MSAHEQRTVYVLSSIAIVWLQRRHRRCHRAAELRYRAAPHVFGRTLACRHPHHHPTPYVAGAISPPRSRSPPPLGSRAGRQLDFSVPRLPDDRRRRILAAVLLRPHHCHGALPAHLWRKADRRQNRRLYRRCVRCFSHCGTRSRWQYAHCRYRLRHRLGLLLRADGHRQQGCATHRRPRKLRAPGERRLCDRADPHTHHAGHPLIPVRRCRRQH